MESYKVEGTPEGLHHLVKFTWIFPKDYLAIGKWQMLREKQTGKASK